MLDVTGMYLPGTNNLADLASSSSTKKKKFYNVDTRKMSMLRMARDANGTIYMNTRYIQVT